MILSSFVCYVSYLPPKGKLYFVPYPNWCTTNDNTFACDFVILLIIYL